MRGDQPIVSVRGLTVGFGDRNVLENVDLDVHRREVLGIVGGSGSGKSVLLRTIIDLLPKRGPQPRTPAGSAKTGSKRFMPS